MNKNLLTRGAALRLIASCATGLFSPFLLALDSDSEQPATLEANTFEIDLQTGQRIYRGDVLYRQGSIRLECDELITNFNDEGELDKAVCTGDPGKFKQRPQDSEDDMLGEARVITLDQVGELVTLESRAQVEQGLTKLNGRLLTYNLKTEKIMVKGGASGQSGKAAEPKTAEGETTAEQTGVEVQTDQGSSRPTIVIQPRKKKETTAE